MAQRNKGVQDEMDQEAQHARFVETARALGCDEDEAAFDERLKVIARHKPKTTPPAEPKPDERMKPAATR